MKGNRRGILFILALALVFAFSVSAASVYAENEEEYVGLKIPKGPPIIYPSDDAGGAGWKYNGRTRTLTLEDAQWTTQGIHFAGFDLTIELKKENAAAYISQDNWNDSQWHSLTITGTGSLSLSNADEQSYCISSDVVSITGGTLNLIPSAGGGISAEQVDISGGDVYVDATATGIAAKTALSISGEDTCVEAKVKEEENALPLCSPQITVSSPLAVTTPEGGSIVTKETEGYQAVVDKDGNLTGHVVIEAVYTEPGLYVGGTRVTSSKAGDVFGDKKVSFSAAKEVTPATLTLNGYTGKYNGKKEAIKGVIYYRGTDPLKIVISGENSLTAGDDTSLAGIYSNGPLIIEGTGSLTATGGKGKDGEDGHFVDYAGGGTGENGESGSDGGDGIAATELIVNGGTVTANGGNGGNGGMGGGGYYAGGNSGSGGSGGSGIKGDLTANGGVVIANGGNGGDGAEGPDMGPYHPGNGGDGGNGGNGIEGDFTINGSDVTASGGDGGAGKEGSTCYPDGAYGSVVLTGDAGEDGSTGKGISGVITFKSPYFVRESEDNSENDSDWSYLDDGATGAKRYAQGGLMETVATPTFSPAGGKHPMPHTVTISCATKGATIYYTTDGSDPTTGSNKYTGPFSISAATTIKAIAVKDHLVNSAINSVVYKAGIEPKIWLDSAKGGDGSIVITGWAYDESDRSKPVEIHVYIGGKAGSSDAEYHGKIIADKERTDVDEIYGCGDHHGFAATIKTKKRGELRIYVYAVDIGDDGEESQLFKSAPVTITDPPVQLGDDGTAVGPGAGEETAEQAITEMTSEKDPAGSRYGILQLKSTKQTKTSVKLTWKKAKRATKFVIYGTACGVNNKVKKLTTVTGTSYTAKKVAGKKIRKGTYYKFIMVALDENGNVVSTSKMVHAATTGGKVGNHKSVTTKAKKNKVTLKKGKTFKLKAKAVPKSKKKVQIHRGMSYESSNPKVATVSRKGVIKAKATGTCYVYAYVQNGVAKIIKVKVK